MSSAIDTTKPEEGNATTQSVRDNFAAAKDEIEALQEAISQAWPIGSIFISTNTTNPNTLLGYGTWSAIAAGKVLVGLSPGEVEFDAMGETGGEKTHVLTTGEMPAHTHIQDAHTHIQNAHSHVQTITTGSTTPTGTQPANRNSTTVASAISTQNATATNQNTTATNQNAGGGGAHNNLQPYLVVKMWERTA